MADGEIKGLVQLDRVIRNMDAVRGYLAAFLRREHERVMTDAKRRTPVKHGTLRNSGTVLPTEVHGDQIVSRGGFGGAAKAYARVQHDNLWWNKKTGSLQSKRLRHTVGEAFFYKRAIDSARSSFKANVASEWRQILQRVVKG